MKTLNQHITEKLIINKNFNWRKIDKSEYENANHLVSIKIRDREQITVNIIKIDNIFVSSKSDTISFKGDDVFNNGYWNMTSCEYYGDALYYTSTSTHQYNYIILPLSYIKTYQNNFFKLFSSNNTITLEDINNSLYIDCGKYFENKFKNTIDYDDFFVLNQNNSVKIDKIFAFIKPNY